MVTEHQYIETSPTDFDREFCINTKQVTAFIEATQKDSFEMIQKKGERSFWFAWMKNKRTGRNRSAS